MPAVLYGGIMIGVQDFNGHYDWTFEYIRRTFGEDALARYWAEAIAFDSQAHAFDLMREKGFDGMQEYWGHTLTQEEAGYAITRTDDVFRIDMHECPSKGYLLEHGLEAYHDYCTHCIGWIEPVAERAGFTVDHEHNHCGQCWWELRRQDSKPESGAAREKAGDHSVELGPRWGRGEHHRYRESKQRDS
jgi:hypothetical protein